MKAGHMLQTGTMLSFIQHYVGVGVRISGSLNSHNHCVTVDSRLAFTQAVCLPCAFQPRAFKR